MNFEKLFEEINIPAQCKKYGISVWRCPQFLFLLMGIFILCSIIITYAIGRNYINDPLVVSLVVLFVALILFIFATIITQSFERMADASRIKTEFINIVSHQLRSPLSNLRWSVDALASGKLGELDEKQKEYIKILSENSSRMAELISSLLMVSKIDEGKMVINKEKVDLESIVSAFIEKTKPFAEASNVKIIFNCDKNFPKVLTDSYQVKLVIENFLDNAIKYSKDRDGVEVFLKKKSKKIIFQVKDSGFGIPKEDQKFIFEKFFRSKNAVRSQANGSGLGLYISKSIVKELKGEIGFNSREKVGSTFWFSLPLK